MSLLHDAIVSKKFDVRMLDKNLTRNVVTDKEAKAVLDSLPDDADNAEFVSLDDIAEQKKWILLLASKALSFWAQALLA